MKDHHHHPSEQQSSLPPWWFPEAQWQFCERLPKFSSLFWEVYRHICQLSVSNNFCSSIPLAPFLERRMEKKSIKSLQVPSLISFPYSPALGSDTGLLRHGADPCQTYYHSFVIVFLPSPWCCLQKKLSALFTGSSKPYHHPDNSSSWKGGLGIMMWPHVHRGFFRPLVILWQKTPKSAKFFIHLPPAVGHYLPLLKPVVFSSPPSSGGRFLLNQNSEDGIAFHLVGM